MSIFYAQETDRGRHDKKHPETKGYYTIDADLASPDPTYVLTLHKNSV